MDFYFFATLLIILAGAVLVFKPAAAKAHCDTMDGPTAKDGLQALESGNINHALKWVEPQYEAELKDIFALSRKVRTLGKDAQQLADRYFLENLVRVHRAGEGEGFTGVKPHGVPMDAKVAAVDLSIHTGSFEPMKKLFSHEELPELENRFHEAMRLKQFDVDDVRAARAFIAAYVSYFKLAEGEEHAHGAHGHSAHSAHAGH